MRRSDERDPNDRAEIGVILDAAHGSGRNALAVAAGICRLAEALEQQEFAFAHIRGLHLPLAERDAGGLRRTTTVSSPMNCPT